MIRLLPIVLPRSFLSIPVLNPTSDHAYIRPSTSGHRIGAGYGRCEARKTRRLRFFIIVVDLRFSPSSPPHQPAYTGEADTVSKPSPPRR
jgi:hypothetical protein